jgi:hypothetical protein
VSARAVGEKVQLLFLDAAFHIPTSTVKVLWFKTTAALNSGVSNQLRLWFSAFAHFLISTLRAWVLRGTELERASIGQIRLRLFKIAAQFKVSVRRIHIELCSALSSQRAFRPNSSSTHGFAHWAAARLTQTKAPTPTSRLPPLQNQLRRHCIN